MRIFHETTSAVTVLQRFDLQQVLSPVPEESGHAVALKGYVEMPVWA